MNQKNIQSESMRQQAEQTQQLSARQMLTVQLTEMPQSLLLRRIEDEFQENPWLENKAVDASNEEKEEDETYRQEDDYSSADDVPDYIAPRQSRSDLPEQIEWADTQTFYEKLQEQAREFVLNERQQQMVDYLIGSLESNGLLTKPLVQIADEMEINMGLRVSEQELEEALHVLWQFDPPGVGARSVQECLLIQLVRKPKSVLRDKLMRVVRFYMKEMLNNQWERIRRRLRLSEHELQSLRRELVRLNPRPGFALSERMVSDQTTLLPDFIVEIDSEGQLVAGLNDGDIPQPVVSAEAYERIREIEQIPASKRGEAQARLQFMRSYVNRGQIFIDALEYRRLNMLKTIRTIAQIQRAYFMSGDETTLVPMMLEDIARPTGLDPSTVSRACNNKYVQTPYGIMAMRWFFSHTKIEADGDQVSTHHIQAMIKELIAAEDPSNPISDQLLTEQLQQRGFSIARRTVSKHRELMGIPVARLRAKGK